MKYFNGIKHLLCIQFFTAILFSSAVVTTYADHGPEHENPGQALGVNGELLVSPAIITNEGWVNYTYSGEGYPDWNRLLYRHVNLYYTQGHRAGDPFFYFFRPVRWGTVSFSPTFNCIPGREGTSDCQTIGCQAGDKACRLYVRATRREGENWRGHFFPNCRAQYYLGPYPETDGGGSQANSIIALRVLGTDRTFEVQLVNPLTVTSSGAIPNCPDPEPFIPEEPALEFSCDVSNSDQADVTIEQSQDVSGRVDMYADIYSVCEFYGEDFDFGDGGSGGGENCNPEFEECDCNPEFEECDDPIEACVEQSTIDWNFGDGNIQQFTSAYETIFHDYQEAGDYTVGVTVQPFGVSTQCALTLRPPTVSVDVDVTEGLEQFINADGLRENRAAVGENIEVQVSVKTGKGFGVVNNVDFDDTENPLNYDESLLSLQTGPESANALPGNFGPEETIFDEIYQFKTIKDGFVTLDAPLSYISLGETKQANDPETFRIGEKVFDVEVTVNPEQLNFDETKVEDLGEECKKHIQEAFDNTAGTGEEPPEKANCIEFALDITNITTSEITNVTVSEFGDFTRAMKSLTPGNVSIPLTQIKVVPPPEMGTTIPSLAAGEKIRFYVLMDAIGGSPDLEVKPIVTGVYQGENVKGSGRAEFKIVEDVVLKVGVQLVRPHLDERHMDYESANAPFSGSPVRLTGYLENYSLTSFVGVTVVALPEENAGRGTLFDANGNGSDGRRLTSAVDATSGSCTEFAEKFTDEVPYFPQAFLLEPATLNEETEEIEPSRINLRGVLATTCMDVFSRAKVRYYVKASTLKTNEEGELITDDGTTIEQGGIAQIDNQLSESRMEFDFSDNHQRDFSVPLKVNEFVEIDPDECQYLLPFFDLACSGVSGVFNLVHSTVTSIPVLLELGGNFVAKSWEYNWRLNHYALKMLGTTMEATLLQDPVAKQRLRTEFEVQAATWVQFGIITNEQAQDFVGRSFENTEKAFNDFAQSDYRTMARRVTYTAGSNIDALLPTKYARAATQMVSRGWQKKVLPVLSQPRREALEKVRKKFTLPGEPELPDNRRIAESVNEAQLEVEKKLSIEESDKLADEFIADPSRDPQDLFNSDNLPPRTKLSLRTAALTGVAETTIRKIQDICTRWKAKCAFRSRGLRAIGKLRNGFAYLKGQAIKLKNTNDIDVKYLNYPEEALDTVILVQPPIDVPQSILAKNKWEADIEFTRQLDEWMAANTDLGPKPAKLEEIDQLVSNGIGPNGNKTRVKIDQIQGIPDEATEYFKVRERLRLRTTEWHDYRSDKAFGRLEDIGKVIDGEVYRGGKYLTEGLPLRFGFREQGLSSVFDKLPFLRGEKRAFRIVEDGKVYNKDGLNLGNPDGARVYGPGPDYTATKLTQTEDGRKIFIPEMDGPSGFRSFTGDIDFVHILDESNTFIKNPFTRIGIYWELINEVGMQHGESFSFFLGAVRAKFLEAHTLGRSKAAETLIEVSEDGIHAAYYASPKRTVLPENTNGIEVLDLEKSRFYINVDTAEATLRATKDEISAVLNARMRARQVRLLIEKIIPAAVNPVRNWANSVDGAEADDVPNIFDTAESDDALILQERNGSFVMLQASPSQSSLSNSSSSLSLESIPLSSTSSPISAEPPLVLTQLAASGAAFSWVEVSVDAVKGADGLVQTVPFSILMDDIDAGDTTVELASLDELLMEDSSAFFNVGDIVLINPEGDNEEAAEIVAIEPLMLKSPLRFDHEFGELITVLTPQLAELVTIEIDTDLDGVLDIDDNCPYIANTDQSNVGGTIVGAGDDYGDACQCGDVNDDGIVNNADAVIVTRHAAGLPPGVNASKCDVTGDGECDDDDAMRIRNVLLGSSSESLQQCEAAQNNATEDSSGEDISSIAIESNDVANAKIQEVTIHALPIWGLLALTLTLSSIARKGYRRT